MFKKAKIKIDKGKSEGRRNLSAFFQTLLLSDKRRNPHFYKKVDIKNKRPRFKN